MIDLSIMNLAPGDQWSPGEQQRGLLELGKIKSNVSVRGVYSHLLMNLGWVRDIGSGMIDMRGKNR